MDTIADGIRMQQLGNLTWPIIRELVEKDVFSVVSSVVRHTKTVGGFHCKSPNLTCSPPLISLMESITVNKSHSITLSSIGNSQSTLFEFQCLILQISQCCRCQVLNVFGTWLKIWSSL